MAFAGEEKRSLLAERPLLGEEDAVGGGFLLSEMPIERNQLRLAGAVVAAMLVALAVTAPYARVPLPGTQPALPAYAAAYLIVELTTAAMLFAMFDACRKPSVLLLAVGYLFCALLSVPWALSFPGVFSDEGLLDAGLQTTATISALHRLLFPAFVIAYALTKDRASLIPHRRVRRTILLAVIGAVAVVSGTVWLIAARPDVLPRFMDNAADAATGWLYVAAVSTGLYLAAAAQLWRRRRAVLDMWLVVVMCTSMIELVLMAFISGGRLSLGWWAGRLYGLASAGTVLVVLLASMAAVYARLIHSVAAESRARATRLATMEALSASIAHELNQPLASAVTNANAALRWLGRQTPNLDEARAALQRIAEDGLRGGQVIESIRAVFQKEARERGALDINAIITTAIRRSEDEARAAQIAIQTDLDRGLPPVNGNAVQLQQVLSNLIANAFEAMHAVPDRSRVLTVRSRPEGAHEVLVSIEDTGIGLKPGDGARVLEPFYSTKPHGMGLGLTICSSIVESHGGRIWAMDRTPRGAIFRFSVPASVDA
ncbi:MAG TPA: MASE4 domain-containing protein [Dongiaceae bacterium]|jgi:signal transduction histidine kinase|nr:MASE4 domain-containing protein [Dongiaceae bacterium]